MRRLILFDLDHTLVRVHPFPVGAYRWMFRKVYGIRDIPDSINFSGLPLFAAIKKTCSMIGIPEKSIKENLPLAIKVLNHEFEKLIDSADVIVLPGVEDLLANLHKTTHVLGIVTGNTGRITRIILKKARIKKYFDIFSYGATSIDRSEIVACAISQANKKLSYSFKGVEVVIIGDSVHDIRSGKKYGAVTVGVATGYYSIEDLEKAGPTYVFNDLKNYRKILKVLG